MADYEKAGPQELSVKSGDVVQLIREGEDGQWWASLVQKNQLGGNNRFLKICFTPSKMYRIYIERFAYLFQAGFLKTDPTKRHRILHKPEKVPWWTPVSPSAGLWRTFAAARRAGYLQPTSSASSLSPNLPNHSAAQVFSPFPPPPLYISRAIEPPALNTRGHVFVLQMAASLGMSALPPAVVRHTPATLISNPDLLSLRLSSWYYLNRSWNSSSDSTTNQSSC